MDKKKMAWTLVFLAFTPFALFGSLFISLQMDALLGVGVSWIWALLSFYVFLTAVVIYDFFNICDYFLLWPWGDHQKRATEGRNKWLTRDEMAFIFAAAALLITMLILLNIRLDTGNPPYWVVFIPLQTLALMSLIYYSFLSHRYHRRGRWAGKSASQMMPATHVLNLGPEAASLAMNVFSPHRSMAPQVQRSYIVTMTMSSVILVFFSIFITLSLEGVVSPAVLYVPVISALFAMLLFVMFFLMWVHNGTIKLDKYPWWQVWPPIIAIVGIDLFALLAYLKVQLVWAVLWTVVFIPLFAVIVALACMFAYAVLEQNPALAEKAEELSVEFDQNQI